MLAKRRILSVWLLLVGAQWLIAGQTWYRVVYTFDGTQKTLNTSGIAAWSEVNGLMLFGAVAFVALLLTRGSAARITTALVALVSASITSLVVSAFSADVPPAVNASVEKLSGIAGGGAGGVSAAIDAVTRESALVWSFAVVAILLVLVQLGAAIGSKNWVSKPRVDKYTTKHMSNITKDAKKTAPSDETDKSRNIELWDSQR